jgi:hypothetical protein
MDHHALYNVLCGNKPHTAASVYDMFPGLGYYALFSGERIMSPDHNFAPGFSRYRVLRLDVLATSCIDDSFWWSG